MNDVICAILQKKLFFLCFAIFKKYPIFEILRQEQEKKEVSFIAESVEKEVTHLFPFFLLIKANKNNIKLCVAWGYWNWQISLFGMIFKKLSKNLKIRKPNIQQENKMPHSKHEYLGKRHSFFTPFQSLRLKKLFFTLFTKKVIFGKKVTLYL